MHLNTQNFSLMLLLVSAYVFPTETRAAETPTKERPNIVFFFADDQTTTTLGCYGNSVIQTPNIDALARGGTRFDNACVSHSICWVSRTTILTGLTGRSYGTPGNHDQARPEAVETRDSEVDECVRVSL